jgi:hypothetical protein
MTEMTTVGEDMKPFSVLDESTNQEVIIQPYNSIVAWDKRESTEEECTCHNAS